MKTVIDSTILRNEHIIPHISVYIKLLPGAEYSNHLINTSLLI